MVSIVAFQAVDPGSIPGLRSLFDDGEWMGEEYRVACLLSLVVEHSLCNTVKKNPGENDKKRRIPGVFPWESGRFWAFSSGFPWEKRPIRHIVLAFLQKTHKNAQERPRTPKNARFWENAQERPRMPENARERKNARECHSIF